MYEGSFLIAEELLLLSLGSFVGAYSRFYIATLVNSKKINSYWGTFFVNILATFLLGFCLSFLEKISQLGLAYQLNLIFSIGFLGSFSTFSSFILEVFQLLLDKKLKTAILILFLSLGLGIIFAAFGYSIGIFI